MASNLVGDDGNASGDTSLYSNFDPRDVPFSGSRNKQVRAANASGPRAIVTQQLPAGCVDKATNDATLGVRHQNERMNLLVAAEHNRAPDFCELVNNRQDAVRRTE